MRFRYTLIVAAALAALSSLALARSSKPALNSCDIEVAAPPSCDASPRLCESWLRGRSAFQKLRRSCGPSEVAR